jgi:hypothetical protein
MAEVTTREQMSAREEKERGRETTPARMAETTPTVYPSGDYSYVLEIVMRMQDTLGQLKEAVGSLKEQSKHHGDKLDQIGKDVHAAKVAMGLVAAIIVGAAGLIGWIVTTYISTSPK